MAGRTAPTAPPGFAVPPLDDSTVFLRAGGLLIDEVSESWVIGHIQLGPDHHTPWGIVHGGVYSTAIGSAASTGASAAVHKPGRTQQLWRVDINDDAGRLIAHGEVRLLNLTTETSGVEGGGPGYRESLLLWRHR